MADRVALSVQASQDQENNEITVLNIQKLYIFFVYFKLYYENHRTWEWARISMSLPPPLSVTEFSNKRESLNIKLVAS